MIGDLTPAVWLNSEVIKFPTIGAQSSVNPPYNPHQLPNRGIVGHYIDRHTIVTIVWESFGVHTQGLHMNR